MEPEFHEEQMRPEEERQMRATPCIHTVNGLCDECRADADEDPEAWEEYGHHPRGIANTRSMMEEIAQDALSMSEEALRGWPRGSMPVVEILADEEAPF